MLESRQTIQKILIICLGFVLFSQVSSATDYYVASYGNDSSNGLTVNTPKLTFSFFAGTNFLKPGNIVYLIDGTWSNQHMIIKSTGNATHPIRITKYNGTPILDGTDRLGTGIIVGQDGGDNFVYPYVNIDNITITRYADGFFSREGMFINLSDMHIYNISTTAVNFLDGHDLNLKDSIIHDTGWNSIQVKSNYYNCYNVIIQNNTVYSNPGVSGGSGHNLIDLYEHFESSNLYRVHNITVEKNRLYDSTNDGIYLHTYNDGTTLPNQSINNTYIYNNTINGTYNGITFDHARNSIISGNIVYDMNAGRGMGYWTGYDYFDNNTLINNTFYGTGLRGFGGIGDTSSSYINLSENNISQYREYTGIANIQNPKLFGYAIINDASTGTVILNYTQGYVFTENGANSVSYLSNGSQYTTVSTGETVTVIKYDIAALPSSGNLTITSPSQTGDSRQITSTVGGGTIIFEGLMENASANYDLWIAGVKEQTVVSGANKVVTFAAETLSGTSIIVINYSTSSGEALSYIPPSPTTLAETNSSSGFWINYTWSAGSGNVTNSYNVSWNNGVDWVNGSTNAFQNFTSLSPHQWVNVSVYAFNSSGNGTLNQTPISMNTQVPNNAPTISFISPTMANGSTNTTGSITVNTTHSDADSDNTTALLNWNNSLVGWWRMNEASGGTLVQDFSGYGNNGTWSGNTTSNVTSGQFGNALSFDGVNDYVNAGNDNSISNLSENFSVLVWFKLYSLPEAGQYPHIVSQRDLSSSTWNIIVHSDFNGNLSFSVPYSTTAANGRIITPILNTWYHLSVVIQTKVIYMYINGVEQSYVSRTTGVGTRTLNSSIPIGIGNRIGGGRDVNGSIDEVRIYNRALSANEISASYNASLYRLNATFSGLVDGEYNYTAYVQDAYGSVAATEKRYVTINTVSEAIADYTKAVFIWWD